MLIDISRGLTKRELETLKFYCSEFIPLARREDIETAVQLWDAVMENGRMSSSDTTFLQEMMEKAVQRRDLLDRVIQYTNCVHVPPQTGEGFGFLCLRPSPICAAEALCFGWSIHECVRPIHPVSTITLEWAERF